jgi:hypothetical protein
MIEPPRLELYKLRSKLMFGMASVDKLFTSDLSFEIDHAFMCIGRRTRMKANITLVKSNLESF